LRSDIDPEENYLVISRNERMGYMGTTDYSSSTPQFAPSNTLASGKSMEITKATFTSIAAKRTVEDWIHGEPEVRLNVLYALINPSNGEITEARNSSFLYPNNWLKLGLFKNDVKWNNSVVQCPFWNENEKYYGRRLIWTEEDGTSKQITIKHQLD